VKGVNVTGFVVGDKGVVVIDPQMTPAGATAVIAEIAKITSKPVNQIIVTHSDPDHIGGIPTYPAGTPVIAQENTKSYMQAGIAAALAAPNGRALYKALDGHLPTHTIASREDMVLDGVRMVLIHTAPAHTAGDLIVYLPTQKIVFDGDLFFAFTGGFPVIHDFEHGTSLGWIESAKVALALDADTYIDGHSEPKTKDTVRKLLQTTEQRRNQIKALVEQNKTLAEVRRALGETVSAQTGPLVFADFTEVVYGELTKGYPPAPVALDSYLERRLAP
jgi:glyoxylase-like metal-dependent hydrolase (beta-lactamase superfamily II)